MNSNLGVVNGDLTTLFGFLGCGSPSAADSVAAAITVWKNKMIVLFHFVDICCITSN